LLITLRELQKNVYIQFGPHSGGQHNLRDKRFGGNGLVSQAKTIFIIATASAQLWIFFSILS
jgi:hypothetical protein